MRKIITLIILSLILHELGHIIIGGGVTGFEYAPDLDPFTTKIIIPHWNNLSAIAGFIFTLPLLFYSRWLILLFLIQSRWDFLYIYVNIIDFHI